MNILKSIQDFFSRFPEANQLGKQVNATDIDQLSAIVKNNLPDFWKMALTKHPLCHLEIGVPSDFGQKELKNLHREQLPLMSIKFLSPSEISEETTNSFPGFVLIKNNLLSPRRYICIATDIGSTQEGIFISTKKGNPQPLLVSHDLGETKTSLIKHSEAISPSLETLFEEAHIVNRDRVISEERTNLAQENLAAFLKLLKTKSLSTPDRISETHSLTEQSILDSIIEICPEEIGQDKIGATVEGLAHGIPELSIPDKRKIWDHVHKLYDVCDFHKGDLYFNEAHSLI